MGDTYFQCDHCHNVFTIKARKGRPPKHCNECKKTAPSSAEMKRQRAIERVDRLSKILESRGMALSQNED